MFLRANLLKWYLVYTLAVIGATELIGKTAWGQFGPGSTTLSNNLTTSYQFVRVGSYYS
jgi:hypothetical protein